MSFRDRPSRATWLGADSSRRNRRAAAATRLGYSEGLLGHLTARDPEHADRFWANPLGISLNRIRVSDVVQVDHTGRLIHGSAPVNPVGVLLHAAVHRARPEVVAVCHAHSVYGSAWSTFARPVDPITQDTAVFFEDQAIVTEPRLSFDPETAERFAAAFGDQRTAIQAGHGLFATGITVDEAARRFISLDKACHVQLLASAAGEPQRWPDEMARGLERTLGSPEFAWLSFQTLWDELLAEGTDFLA
jgi:ribulose-5-phosphate 4-epimerase/fuculose-1-phosphate aldolase